MILIGEGSLNLIGVIIFRMPAGLGGELITRVKTNDAV
jgi:hypothetical protein